MSLKVTKKDLNANVNAKNTCGSLEDFVFPKCWEDDDRMAELLAAFRLRELNPNMYDTKLKFWQDLISQFCLHKGSPTFSKRELQLAFVRGNYLPYCLDTVLNEMLRMRKIRLRSEYVYDPLNSWSGWAMQSFVRKPLFWGIHKIKSSIIGINVNSQAFVEYIHLEVIKKFCKDLQTNVLPELQGKLLHFDEFKKHLTDCARAPKLTDPCLLLCLHTLEAQCKVGLEYKEEDGERQLHLIKIPTMFDPNTAITQADHDVHNLRITQTNILRQLEDIAEEIKENDEKTRQCLKENKRKLAKTYLRKKHLLEQTHEKRSTALHNIETLLNSVNDAQYNGEILDAYKIGAKALQKTLNESGLKYDNVDEVIASVADGIEMHQDVQHSLANANIGDINLNENDDELERELEAILGENVDVTQKSQEKQSNITVATPTENKIATTSMPTITTVTNNVRNMQETAARTIEITDDELLNMLEELEVEDTTLPFSSTLNSNLLK